MRISDWSSDVCSSDLPFGIPRLRRFINIALDDRERRRIKGAAIPAAGMENATITPRSHDFYKRVYVRSTRRRHGKPRLPGSFAGGFPHRKCWQMLEPVELRTAMQQRSEERRVGKESVSTG